MICPNCGSHIENQGKFCAVCGVQLPTAAPPSPAFPPAAADIPPAAPTIPLAPAAPPAWAQTPPPPPPATPAAPPAWTQTPPPAVAPVGAPWGQTPPPPGAYYAAPPAAYYAAPPAAAAGGSAFRVGGLLALVGGIVAVASAWLPWFALGNDPMNTSWWGKPIDLTSGSTDLANGNYLIAAGAVAAICGLLLVLGIAKTPGLRLVLAVGAIAGAVGIGAVELAAYNKVNEGLSLSDSYAIGWGLYVGAGGAVLAGLGGLAALISKPGTAGSSASSQAIIPVLGVVLVVALAGGLIYGWPQISKQFGGTKSSPSVLFASPTPTAEVTVAPTETPTETPTEAPTETPTEAPTAAPTPAQSFLTSGYSTPELAINQFVDDQGYTYGGDCSSAAASADYCSSFVSDVSNGHVYSIGAPGSEAEVWALMRQVDGQWYMADVASASAGSPAPWQ